MKNKKSNEISMNKDTQRYFALGLRQCIAESGLTGKKFVEGITTDVNLSRVLKRGEDPDKGSGTSATMRQAMADRLGKDVHDIILLGSKIAAAHDHHLGEPPPVENDTRQLGPVQQLTSFISAYTETEGEMRFWRQLFESYSMPTCVMYNSVILYQNASHRRLVGGSCVGDGCCSVCRFDQDGAPCAIRRFSATGTTPEGMVELGGNPYTVIVNPFTVDSELYVAVTLMPAQHLQDEARKSEKLKKMLSAILDSAWTGILLIEEDNIITHRNKLCNEMLNIGDNDLNTVPDLFGYLAEHTLTATETIVAIRQSKIKARCPKPIEVQMRSGIRYWFEFMSLHSEEGEWLGTILRVYPEGMYDTLIKSGYSR